MSQLKNNLLIGRLKQEWKRRLPAFLAAHPTPGPSFYSHVYHPHFNIDAEEAETTARRFGAYLDVVGKNVSRFREIFTQVRDAGAGECAPVSVYCSGYMVLTAYSAEPRADLVCHWEDSDAVAQEVFANVRCPISFPFPSPFTPYCHFLPSPKLPPAQPPHHIP